MLSKCKQRGLYYEEFLFWESERGVFRFNKVRWNELISLFVLQDGKRPVVSISSSSKLSSIV
jgi:hypothetical protein